MWMLRIFNRYKYIISVHAVDTAFQQLPQFGLIYIYSIGQQGKPYIKAFDLRLEAVQHNI